MKVIIRKMVDDSIERDFADFMEHSKEVQADIDTEDGVLRIVQGDTMLEIPTEIFHGIGL